jgi:UDP-N-acetylmuramyl tripeptide synthase
MKENKLINKFVEDASCPYCDYDFMEELRDAKYDIEELSDEGDSVVVICPDCHKKCEVELNYVYVEHRYRTYQIEGEEEKEEEEKTILEYPGQLHFKF